MTARGYYRGHPMSHIADLWRYDDTGQPVSDQADRPCGHCGLPNTPEGHDGCLGTLPGVRNACCGHGRVREAYVVLDSGRRLAGLEALQLATAGAERSRGGGRTGRQRGGRVTRCAACKGAAHPASGCQYSATVLVCGPCVRRFWAWANRHTKARKGRPDFYGAVARSRELIAAERERETPT